MQKFQKLFLIVILGIMFLFLISLYSKTDASSGDLYLNNLNFDVQINSDGSMDVVETWNIDISDTNTLFKTFKTDKSKYSKIKNVEVTQVTSNRVEKNLKKINELMYHVTKDCYYGMKNDDGNFEIAWGVGLDSGKATRTYKISYTVEDAIKKCDGFSELYWQFVGKDFKISANSITGKITLPDKAENKNDIKVWGHTEGLNGEIYATSKDTVKFEINKFRYGRFVEVRVAIPEDIYIYSDRSDTTTLQDVINEETVWANKANARRERKRIGAQILYILAIIVVIGLDILLIIKAVKNKKKYNELPEKLKPTQEIKYYRDIPQENLTPSEALRMLKLRLSEFMSTEVGNIFSATLLDLSLKGLIGFENEIGKNGKQDIKISIKNSDTTIIQNNEDELLIFNFLKDAVNSKGEVITTKELEKYIKAHQTKVVTLKNSLDSSTERKIFEKGYADKEQKNKKDKHTGFAVLYLLLLIFTFFAMIIFPIIISDELEVLTISPGYSVCFVLETLILCVLSVINMIIKIKITNKINVFTQLGVDSHSEWKGLKKFMEEFSMLDKREVPEITIWEKYLVYATAFGIADKVIEKLKIVYPNFEEMSNMNTGIYIGLMMNTNFSSSFSHSVSSAMSSAYSSGSGGGGGFSGGGGRRSEVAGGGGGR